MSRASIKRRTGPLTFDHIQAWSKPDSGTGCWIWQRATKRQGYGVLREGKQTLAAHRRSYELFHGVVIPDGLDACHACDNPKCVNPAHIFIGTREDNMRDCASKGRISTPNMKGEELTQSKLTENQVLYIRSSGKSQRGLARELGVDRGTIACVIKRKTWRHI